MDIEKIAYHEGGILEVWLTNGVLVHILPQQDGHGWCITWFSGLYNTPRPGVCHDRTELGVQRALERLLEGERIP